MRENLYLLPVSKLDILRRENPLISPIQIRPRVTQMLDLARYESTNLVLYSFHGHLVDIRATLVVGFCGKETQELLERNLTFIERRSPPVIGANLQLNWIAVI